MKKKKSLFKSYNLDLTSNEKKIMSTFSKQVLKQVTGNQQFYNEEKAFTSILDKLSKDEETIKLTKNEFNLFKNQLSQNVVHLEKEMAEAWFFKKWLYKSMVNQYRSLLENHFEG